MQDTLFMNGSEAKPKRRPLTRAIAGKVYHLMSEHGSLMHGVWWWHDGWSDERVRDAVDMQMHIRTIIRFRWESFGKTEKELARKKPGERKKEKLVDKHTVELVVRVAALEDLCLRLMDRLAYLENGLGVTPCVG